MSADKDAHHLRHIDQHLKELLKTANDFAHGAFILHDKRLAIISDDLLKICAQIRDYSLEERGNNE